MRIQTNRQAQRFAFLCSENECTYTYIWNHLSKDAKIASSLYSFKAALDPSDFFLINA